MPYAYRKSERIRKNAEFAAAMKEKRLSVDGLSLFYAKNDTGKFRVGISVSKKLANAVKRNRLRRQLRDCIGKTLRAYTAGFDLVFVARRAMTGAAYEQILKTVETVLFKTVLRNRKPEGAEK